MKLRKTGRIAIAGLAAAAALTMTACGSDDSDSDTTAATTSAAVETTEAESDLPPVPSVEDLNAQLQRALDPAVPNEEKLAMVQGAEADPELPSKLTEFYTTTGAQIEVTGVDEFGGELQATADLTVNGESSVAEVPFVAEDGVWKVQQTWACTMLANVQVESPACAP